MPDGSTRKDEHPAIGETPYTRPALFRGKRMSDLNIQEHKAELVEFIDTLRDISHDLSSQGFWCSKTLNSLNLLLLIRKAKTMLHEFNKFSDDEIMELIKQARGR